MDLGLNDKTVLVTGATGGIGRATALGFAREGAHVAVTFNVNRDAALETARMIEDIGGNALALHLDLQRDETIRDAVDAVVERFGAVHVLVNNAMHGGTSGAMSGVPRFEDVSPEQWRPRFRTTIEGVYLAIQCVLPSMRRAGWGRIVNVSSSLVERGLPGAGAYAAAKAGLHGLTKTLARELAPDGILTNVVAPGLTTSDRTLRTRSAELLEQVARDTPTGRLTTPEEVASVILFLGSAANGHVNGETIRVSGGGG